MLRTVLGPLAQGTIKSSPRGISVWSFTQNMSMGFNLSRCPARSASRYIPESRNLPRFTSPVGLAQVEIRQLRHPQNIFPVIFMISSVVGDCAIE